MKYVCKSDKESRRNPICFIVEGYRDKDKVKHRTIKSLGKLKDLEVGNPNYLAELKENVKAGKFQPESETLLLTLDLSKRSQIHSKTMVGC